MSLRTIMQSLSNDSKWKSLTRAFIGQLLTEKNPTLKQHCYFFSRMLAEMSASHPDFWSYLRAWYKKKPQFICSPPGQILVGDPSKNIHMLNKLKCIRAGRESIFWSVMSKPEEWRDTVFCRAVVVDTVLFRMLHKGWRVCHHFFKKKNQSAPINQFQSQFVD